MKESQSQLANSSPKTIDVLCVSDMCVDVVLTGNVRPQFKQVEQIIGDCSIELGGSANIFASQMAKLGSRAGVVGWIGRDAFGELALRMLQECGVDTRQVRRHEALKTGIGFALSEPDDRAILTYMGTIDATRAADLEESLLVNCRHWHVASLYLLRSLEADWLPWLRKAREMGVTTSLDTNWDPQNRWDGVTELLPYVNVFLPNEGEALAIAGTGSVQSAARELAKRGSTVVVKRGEKGVVAVRGEQVWELEAAELGSVPENVVDNTGAGDNFDAGFVHGWMAGMEMEACLALGHRCAVSSLGALGGIRGQIIAEKR